ncbi:hypothetical protein UFOVP387_44 [uncultured Caudovirales phage]|jgi:hypothetical protein|uniref:Uncharacterized protein n=1 Tax=uncultured Caudovirales phage TaxID=2100421 RepID=A0A6J7X749_9CAUD|nr:hypothetical protein UFOVP387_44 [uncultured Caudovirales phage]
MELFIVILVVILALVFLATSFFDCDVLITPVKGVMFGALYNDDVYDTETDHTIQILILFISFNFLWTTSNGLNK